VSVGGALVRLGKDGRPEFPMVQRQLRAVFVS
jgi:hypothetical protein